MLATSPEVDDDPTLLAALRDGGRMTGDGMGCIDRRLLVGGLLALAPGFAAVRPAAAADTAEIVRQIAAAIGREYHNADRGRKAEQVLLRALRAGAYGNLADGALAERLTTDAQAVLNDGHFGIMAGAMGSNPGGGPARPHEPPHRPTPDDLAFLQADNFGVNAVQVLAGDIGRIDIRQFYRPIDEVVARYAGAMTQLADTSALIVDCTRCIGGDPKTVALFASYFFDREPFVLNRFHWRNLPVEEFRTTRTPGGPRYGEKRPVVVALSADSFSAAEEFAYDMQVLRRGVVVGRKTAGAANHGLPVVVAGAYTLFVPQARAENPVTGTNWEGVGVTPDIVVAQAGGIARAAHRAALEQVVATGSADRRASAQAALDA